MPYKSEKKIACLLIKAIYPFTKPAVLTHNYMENLSKKEVRTEYI